jgi:hypothetical protein
MAAPRRIDDQGLESPVMPDIIHNARIQLLATLLNTMAGTSFTVGIAAPIAAGIFCARCHDRRHRVGGAGGLPACPRPNRA